ncbi:HyaD/HybD family hydrogenase maturation endopeptidase [Propionivibrio sp.]|uniref:HyaD/HybD family hydrogenase maturation endopeptidase n=1 Tax=Propionivibrio sp. TaxID=2212460 RepID=UPI003BF21B33
MADLVQNNESDESILVLGIGNILFADEGFGVRAVQALHSRWSFPDRVILMDGGTQGFNLLTHVQAATRMIVFDAIDYGLPPGTLKVLTNDQVPRFMGSKKLSLHQTGFQDVLGVAELTGHLPSELILIGVQPEELDDFGGSIRPVVKAQIQPALEIALDYLLRWGCQPKARDGGLETAAYLLPESLDMEAYESGGAYVTGRARRAVPVQDGAIPPPIQAS